MDSDTCTSDSVLEITLGKPVDYYSDMDSDTLTSDSVPDIKPDEQNDFSPREFYIHLINLPWKACHKDIIKFFEGIQIPFGGISMFGKEAFIIVTSKEDQSRALSKNEEEIMGEVVFVSCTNEKDVYTRKRILATRRLRFKAPKPRKIRPTAIQKKSREECLYDLFNPEERNVDCQEHYRELLVKRRARKIRPTLMDKMTRCQRA